MPGVLGNLVAAGFQFLYVVNKEVVVGGLTESLLALPFSISISSQRDCEVHL